MKFSFEVDMPFEVPTLRFVLERDYRGDYRGLCLSCYFDKGRDFFGLGIRLKSIDELGAAAQNLAKSAAWTVECLERWPVDSETGFRQMIPVSYTHLTLPTILRV